MTLSMITTHFVHDHHILDALFAKFCQEKQENSPNSTNTLNDLKNAFERHWREEEILYNSYQGQEEELLDKIRLILNQHKLMASFLMDLYQEDCNLKKHQEINNLFVEHRKLEERYVYVKFDEVLSEEERQKVIDDLKLYSKESEFGTPSKINLN